MTDTWNGEHLLEALRAAARDLERHAASLNALNVFPVPDGDTGTNMALTLSSALSDITPHPSCSAVAERVGYWATMCGRGNSGIILSQILRGVATALAGHHLMSGRELAAALAHGSARAYEAVLRPVEGTMLTVIRCAGEAAQRAIAAGEASLSAVLDAAVREARTAVARTPQLLTTLRDAGVVDAGGQGLLVLLEALLRYARGETGVTHAPAATPTAIVDEHAGSAGYCTSFCPSSRDRVAGYAPARLRGAGRFAGGCRRLHPGQDTSAYPTTGRCSQSGARVLAPSIRSRWSIWTCSVRHAMRVRRLPTFDRILSPTRTPACTLRLASSHWRRARICGNPARPARDLVLETTTPPTIDEWRSAFERLPQQDVIVLPNDPQAAETALAAAHQIGRRIHIVPADSPPQGIAALLALNFQANVDQNVQAMMAAVEQVRVITFDEQQCNAIDTPAEATQGAYNVCYTLHQIGANAAEIATLYYGQAVDRAYAERLAQEIEVAFPMLHVEVYAGGQPGGVTIALE